jgi:hypothetical protein
MAASRSSRASGAQMIFNVAHGEAPIAGFIMSDAPALLE